MSLLSDRWLARAVAVFGCVLSPVSVWAGDRAIAERGRPPSFSIQVEASGPSASYAAEELRDYVEKLTGVSLPIVVAEADGSRILLTAGDADLGDDGFRLRADERGVVVSGGKRGILYGVYELLERFGGVDWLTSWCEEVPRLERFEIPRDLDFVGKPAFPVRELFWTDPRGHPEFAARLRLNNKSWGTLDGKYGGNACAFSKRLGNCHTFEKLVPAAKHFKAHPEYFSEIGGERVGERAQLCLSNPDVVALVVSNVVSAIDAEPEAVCFGVSQNDLTGGYCLCARCRAIDEAEGSPSGSVISFANKVAAGVAAQRPGKIIETLAYTYSRRPPKTLRPRDDVMVCLCDYECDFGRSLTKSGYGENVTVADGLRKWSAISDRLYVWDYCANFLHYVLPHPNMRALCGNIRFFRDNRVYFLFEQGNYGGYHGDLGELKVYLMAKLAWDPDRNPAEIVSRFLKGYYGKAAPFVGRYLRELAAVTVDEKTTPLKCTGEVGALAEIIPEDVLERAESLWRQAEREVVDDPAHSYNVRMSSLSVDCLLFGRHFKRIDVAGRGRESRRDCRALAQGIENRFAEAERAGRPVALSEKTSLDRRARKRIRAVAAGEMSVVGDGVSATMEEDAFTLVAGLAVCHVVDDTTASGGKALWLDNDNYDWNTTLPLNEVAFEPGKEYEVLLRLRAKATGKEGEVLQIGVYEPKSGKTVCRVSLDGKNLNDGYAEYKTLSWVPREDQTIYLAPGWFDKSKMPRSQAHNGVWIDGLTIRRKD